MFHVAANLCDDSPQVTTTNIREVASNISVSKLLVVNRLCEDPREEIRVVSFSRVTYESHEMSIR